ncbi:superinfection immunity protein [Chloroflexota bacterium]
MRLLLESITALSGMALFLSLTTVFLVVVGLVLLYFVPTLIAAERRKQNVSAILVLNLFLGWSGIAWIIALVWAVTIDHRDAL